MEFKEDAIADPKRKKNLKKFDLLMAQKRQLNVVLSRILSVPPAPAVDTKQAEQFQYETISLDSSSKDGSVSDKDNQEVKINEPVSRLATTNLHQQHNITSESHSSNFNSTLQLSSCNDKKESYKPSFHDFQNFIHAATERAVIKLSIDNPDADEKKVQAGPIEDNMFDDMDSEPISIFFCTKPDHAVVATTDLTKEQEENLPISCLKKVCKKCSLLESQDIKNHNTGTNTNQIVQNLPLMSEIPTHTNQDNCSERSFETFSNEIVLKKQIEDKDDTQKESTGVYVQEKDNLVHKFKNKSKRKSSKRKMNNEYEKNKEYQNKVDPEWKIKKAPKIYSQKRNILMEPKMDMVTQEIQADLETAPLEANNNVIDESLTNNITKGQDQQYQSIIPKLKRPRGRPLKKKLLNKETEKTHEVLPEEVNCDCGLTSISILVNPSSDAKAKKDEDLKFLATEASEESQIGCNMQTSVSELKSIEHELRLLRKKITCLTATQNRIVALLEHALNPNSELHGKTLKFEGIASF